MSLPRVEQFILDHIQSNQRIREFWEGKIAEWRSEGKSEDEVATTLADNLHLIYMGDESAREDLEGLIDYVSLMTADYNKVAFAFLGRDFRTEAVAAMIKPPSGWPEPYYILREGNKLGPFSYAQIRIKWADEELNAEDKAYHESSGQWVPLRELAEPWTVDGFVPPAETSTPAKPVRTEGTKEKPIPIISASYIGVAIHAEGQIDRLFGKGKWVKRMDYGDIHGLRCWVVQLEDGSTEEVWFDYSPAAALVARREAGEKVGILDSLPAAKRKEFQKAVQQGMAEGQQLAQLRKFFKDGGKSNDGDNKDESSAASTASGCGCCLVGIAGIGVLIFASETATRVWTVVGLIAVAMIFGAISSFFDNRLKKKRANAPTPREIVNQKIDAGYAEYQRINLGKYWPGTSGEAESRAAHRKWWKEEYKFNFPDID